MKRSRIVEMLDWHPTMTDQNPGGLLSRIERIVAVAVAEEREACAEIADMAEPFASADLIRKRGQQ